MARLDDSGGNQRDLVQLGLGRGQNRGRVLVEEHLAGRVDDPWWGEDGGAAVEQIVL